MPVPRLVIALFIVLGSSAVGLGGKLMVLSSLPMQTVHKASLQRKGRRIEISVVAAARSYVRFAPRAWSPSAAL